MEPKGLHTLLHTRTSLGGFYTTDFWTTLCINAIKVSRNGSICCCSVAKSCLTLCDPMDCSTQASLSLTIPWSLPKFMSIEFISIAQVHAFQPSHYLLPSCLFAQHQVEALVLKKFPQVILTWSQAGGSVPAHREPLEIWILWAVFLVCVLGGSY